MEIGNAAPKAEQQELETGATPVLLNSTAKGSARAAALTATPNPVRSGGVSWGGPTATFGVQFRLTPTDYTGVKVTAAKARNSDAELLDQATTSLLKAVKQNMLKKQARVDYAKLRKDGYSDRFLAKLEGA